MDDGTRVSAETFRRIACDCGLVAVSGDAGSAHQLNIGRRSRQIPPAIRRALSLRDRGCRFPGCTNTRFLHGHHLRHWLHGGQTSLTNLVQLCTAHHHLVHEGGWRVELDADGLAFTAPDGCQDVQWTGQSSDTLVTFTVTAEELTAVAENNLLWTDQKSAQPGRARRAPRRISRPESSEWAIV